MHPDLGYLGIDKTGATSYVGDQEVYQSRQAIYVDLGTPRLVLAGAERSGPHVSLAEFRVRGLAAA